ncbi:hypothetical protein ACH3XW_26135 [Acanthocheilonema viteae]
MVIAKFLATTLFSLLLLYSIIGNTALLIILHKDRNIFLNRTFVYICLHLIICAFISYIPQVTIILPETVNEDLFSEYKKSYIYRIGLSIGTFCFFAMLQFTFLLALSRCIFFILPRFNNIFTGIKMHVIMAFTWLLAAFVTIFEMYSCMNEFNGANLERSIKCKTYGIGKHYLRFRLGAVLGIPIIIFVMYTVIFNNLRRKRSSVFSIMPRESQNISWISRSGQHGNSFIDNGRNNAEASILIQGSIVCFIVEFEILSLIFLRQIGIALFDDKADIYLNIFANCFVIFFSAIQPTVYFIYNKRIRHYMTFELLRRIKNTKETITISQIIFTFSVLYYTGGIQQFQINLLELLFNVLRKACQIGMK